MGSFHCFQCQFNWKARKSLVKTLSCPKCRSKDLARLVEVLEE